MSAGFAGQAVGSELVAGTWTVVPAESTAAFRVRDKLVGAASGTIPVRGGMVRLDAGSAVESAMVELDVACIDTGNRDRDRDLRKPHFLSAVEHPVIVVRADRAVAGSAGWQVAATLTARGAAVPVDLAVSMTAVDTRAATVRVTGRLDRTGLGIRTPTFIVGRMIDIDVRLAFRR